ncbi:MAG: hypothetical protein NTV94_17470 [Planctomycetota bacterium]|nr:hypothetical protein [Planctomycetota bacterium]
MTLVMAVDPGPQQSAYVTVRPHPNAIGGLQIVDFCISDNANIKADIWGFSSLPPEERRLVIEQIASMGMSVGAETFETCVWTGRFMETFEAGSQTTAHRIPRVPIKVHLCGTAKAKDANVRQALIDRFGGSSALRKPKAAKKNRHGAVIVPAVDPGPLAGISSHCWAALALACVYVDRMEIGEFA